jgi:peroxiredoxin
MKPKAITAIVVFMCGFLALAETSCKKANPPAPNTTNETKTAISPAEERQRRLAWNLKTLVEPYEHAGYTNAKWDDFAKLALIEFARARAIMFDTNEPWAEIISTNAAAAVQAGCDDPMVDYLFVKFSLNQTNSSKTFADAFYKVAMNMQKSSYPAIRKFYADQRAVDQLFYTYGYGNSNIVTQPIFVDVMPLIGRNLLSALEDQTMPAVEAFEACDATLTSMMGEGIADTNAYIQAYHAMEKPIFKNWPDAYTSWLLKGEGYVELAWAARGYGFANTVSEESMRLFEERLAIAENALTNAWQLNPEDSRIADKMLEVELGQGEGRDRLELWFGRAMALNPNDLKACSTKLNYLQPKWYGSEDDLLTFGWECVQSKVWGGKVPLILLDAHEAIAGYLDGPEKTNYWKQTDVWLDVQSAFDRFFALNPDATSWYHNYAWYAYRCERWKKLNELIPKLGRVNYSYFGGKDAFDKMVRLAKEHASDIQTETLTPSEELKRLVTKIHGEVDEGKTNETDFADELKTFDTLLAKHKDEKTDTVAQILFAEAMTYLQLFDDTDKGVELIKRLKVDFPGTEYAQNAAQVLAAIQKQSEAKEINDALAIGTTFPDFDEKDLAGHRLSIANYKGQVVLLDFWATWCGPCVAELPNVVKTYENYHSSGFEIIGISLDEDQTKLTTFVKGKNVTWPQFFDGLGWGNKLAVKYGIESIPATFLLDGNGKIVDRDLRGEELEQAVAKAMK